MLVNPPCLLVKPTTFPVATPEVFLDVLPKFMGWILLLLKKSSLWWYSHSGGHSSIYGSPESFGIVKLSPSLPLSHFHIGQESTGNHVLFPPQMFNVYIPNVFMDGKPWVISHVPIFHITQPLDSMIGIWSFLWLLFQVMSNIPKSWDI